MTDFASGITILGLVLATMGIWGLFGPFATALCLGLLFVLAGLTAHMAGRAGAATETDVGDHAA